MNTTVAETVAHTVTNGNTMALAVTVAHTVTDGNTMAQSNTVANTVASTDNAVGTSGVMG